MPYFRRHNSTISVLVHQLLVFPNPSTSRTLEHQYFHCTCSSCAQQSRPARPPTGAATWRTRPNNIVWSDTQGIRLSPVSLISLRAYAPPLCEYMTSSTKSEVHNVSHCRQRRTEPRTRITRRPTENFVNFNWTCGFRYALADSQTERLTDIETRSSQYFALRPSVK